MDSICRECVAATAEAALASAVFLALPPPLTLLAPVAAVAMLAPALLSRMPAARRGDALFAPDPLSPDFVPLAATIREMLEDAKASGARRGIVLTPMPAQGGGFAEYSVLWRPASSSVEVAWAGGAVRRRTAATVLPDAPMPVRVGRHPVRLIVSPDRRTGRAAIAVELPPRLLRALNPMSDVRRSAYLAYLAAVVCLILSLPHRRPTSVITLVVAAAAPVLIRRLVDFAPRLRRNLPWRRHPLQP